MVNKTLKEATKYIAIFLVAATTDWILSENHMVWKSLLFSTIITFAIAVISAIQRGKSKTKE